MRRRRLWGWVETLPLLLQLSLSLPLHLQRRLLPHLQRRARNEEAKVRGEHADDLREDTLLVLDAVRLVDDEVAPRQLPERRFLLDGIRYVDGMGYDTWMGWDGWDGMGWDGMDLVGWDGMMS